MNKLNKKSKTLPKNLEKDFSQTMETKTELLPYFDYLLQDLWALGSSPEHILEALKPLKFPSAKVKGLDLGCGKGIVSITLAKHLGFQMVGVDAFQPFLDAALKKAKEFGISDLCQFNQGDMREFIKKAENFDLIIYASVGNILGDFSSCVTQLRKAVLPGGYMIIDDGFLKLTDKPVSENYSHYLTHSKTLEQLTSSGDTLTNEIIFSDQYNREQNKNYMEFITKRANELKSSHPQCADSLSWYIKNQQNECELLEKYFTGAMWLLQKRT